MHPVAMVGDVCKMFPKVALAEKATFYTAFYTRTTQGNWTILGFKN